MRALDTLAVSAAAVCLSATASAQFGPDGQGWLANVIPNNFADISATGTNITAGFGANLDDSGQVVVIGFPFKLYGVALSVIGVSTNGYLADDPGLADFTNDCPIANPFNPNRGLYPFWSDLRLTEHGDVYTELQSSSPNQVFIVQWDDVGTFDDSGASITMQVKLFEACNIAEYHYENMLSAPAYDATGGTASIGSEGNGGLTAVEISCNTSGTIVSNVSAFEVGQGGIQVPRVGIPPNPGALVPSPSGPSVGQIWSPRVSVLGSLLDIVFVDTRLPINVPTVHGTLLCQIPPPSQIFFQTTPGLPFMINVPNDCGLACQNLCTQGGSITAFGPLTIVLTNALDCIIGSL